MFSDCGFRIKSVVNKASVGALKRPSPSHRPVKQPAPLHFVASAPRYKYKNN